MNFKQYVLYFRHNGLSPKVILKKNKHEMSGCNVEKAYTFKDVYTHVYPMVTYLGPYAHCDPVLLIKLIRIGKTYMKMVLYFYLYLKPTRMSHVT